METKEAAARIKINKLLEAAGWRFFPEGSAPANIRLEPSVTIRSSDLDALGDDFEKSSKGFIDFLLLDVKSFPLIVLEAKSEDKNPLVGKEQARKYAKSQNCRFVILSNGNLHYFWDLERGNPYLVTSFPTPDSVIGYQQVAPNPQRLIEDPVGDDYIVLSQRPNYASEAAWKNENERPGYIQANKLRFLRPYQLKAIHALQEAVKDRRQAVSPIRQRTARVVSGGPPRTGGAGQEGLRGAAICRLSDGDLQGEPRRLAAGRNRGHHGAVAALQQQVPAALLADRF
jgi:type I restriction enzyme R subunit